MSLLAEDGIEEMRLIFRALEERVGKKGYIHGWIYVGLHPHVGQDLHDPKGHPGETGKIVAIDGQGVHVKWSGGATTEHGALKHKAGDVVKTASGKTATVTGFKQETGQHTIKYHGGGNGLVSPKGLTSAHESTPKAEAPKAEEAAKDAGHKFKVGDVVTTASGKKATITGYKENGQHKIKYHGGGNGVVSPKNLTKEGEENHEVPKVNVTGDGKFKPGDIVTTKSGKKATIIGYDESKGQHKIKYHGGGNGIVSPKGLTKVDNGASKDDDLAAVIAKKQAETAAKLAAQAKVDEEIAKAKKAEADALAKAKAEAESVNFGKPAGSIPTDFSGMKKIAGPHGSQSGQWYQDADGSKYYVKTSTTPANEVGAMKVYEAAGLKPGEDIPLTAVVDGKVASKEIPGLVKNSKESWANAGGSAASKDTLKKLFAASALTSHYDTAGQGMDNTLYNPKTGKPVMIESGGAMATKAMGGKKAAWVSNAPLAGEVAAVSGTGTVPNPQMKALFSSLSDADKASALEDLHAKLSAPGALDKLDQEWQKAGMSSADRSKNMAVIKSRLADMPGVAQKLKGSSAPKETGGSSDLKYGDVVTDSYGNKATILTAPDSYGNVTIKDHSNGQTYTSVKSSHLTKVDKESPSASSATKSTPFANGATWPSWAETDGDAEYKQLVQKHMDAKALGKPSSASYYKKLAKEHYDKVEADAENAPASQSTSVNGVSQDFGNAGSFMGHVLPGFGSANKDIQDFIAQHQEPVGHKAHKKTPESIADFKSMMDHFNAAGLDKSKKETSGSTEAAIRLYTGSSYKTINGGLRKGKLSSEHTSTVHKIDQAFTLSDKDYKLFRGLSGSQLFENARVGDVFADHGISSTTITEGSFNTSSSHNLLHITVPKGNPLIWANPVSHFEGSENEALLPRNQHLVITKIEKKDGRTHVHVTALPKEMIPEAKRAQPRVK